MPNYGVGGYGLGAYPVNVRWEMFLANNQIHIGSPNGVYFYDGSVLRKSGIRSLTASEAAAINVNTGQTYGVRSPTSGEAAGVTVGTASTGGTIGPTTSTGYQLYMFYFKPGAGWSQAVAIGSRVTFASGSTNKITLSGLPNLSGVDTGLIKMFGITSDGGSPAYLSMKFFTQANLSNGSLTVTATTGFPSYPAAGDYFLFNSSDDPGLTGFYQCVTSGSGKFTFTIPRLPVVPFTNPVGGNPFSNAFFSTNTGTTLDITASTNSTYSSDVSQWIGIPASSVLGAQPGYQFYDCLYNPVTGHCGNRMPIGARFAPTAPVVARIDNLPNVSAESTEWVHLLGRTIDGGEVPYVLVDSGGNRLTVPSSTSTAYVNGSFTIDLTSEMPSRNGVPPQMDKFVVIGDQVIGCTPNTPYVYISGSAANPINPTVVGRPEQSWAPQDVLTFPGREVPVAIHRQDATAWVFSRTLMVRLVNTIGIWDWDAEFPMGIAGQRAFAQTIHGPFWLTSKKQLATSADSGPEVISGEYENSLLSKIGDVYLDHVELVPFVDAAKGKDELIIKCKDVNGNPFEIIHDFRLKEAMIFGQGNRAPYGQAYERAYVGALATDYTLRAVNDVNGVRQSYAGGNDGNLYQTENGYSDNGSEFVCDYMSLLNMGPTRPFITDVELWGDSNMLTNPILSYRRNLDGSDDWLALTPQADRGQDKDFRYHHRFKGGEMNFCYLRFNMTSHSADAPATILNDPPHQPLEVYGKVYAARILYGTAGGSL